MSHDRTESSQEPSRNGNESDPGMLLSLTEVADVVDISPPTLRRYLHLHGDRIPVVGEGLEQRFPREALSAFRELHRETLEQHGLPRPGGQLLSLTAQKRAAERSTSEPSSSNGDSLPAKATATGDAHGSAEGSTPQHAPEATSARRPLPSPPKPTRAAVQDDRDRRQSPGGEPEEGAMAHRIASLEAGQQRLEHVLRQLNEELREPLSGTVREL